MALVANFADYGDTSHYTLTMSLKALWVEMTDSPSKMSRKVMERYWKTVCDKHSPSAPLADVISQCDPDGTGYFEWKSFFTFARKHFKIADNEIEEKEEGEEGVKERYERVRKRVGVPYSLVEHTMYCCAVGECAMLKYIVEKKKIDPQTSCGTKCHRFKESDTLLSLSKRYENRTVRKFLEGKIKKMEKKEKRGGEEKKEKKFRRTPTSVAPNPSSSSSSGPLDAGSVDQSYLIQSSELDFFDNKTPVGEQGGTASVFRAKYLGTVVAVKVLNRGLTDSAIDTFTKEISVMSKLHHPHVVLLMGACLNDPHNLMIVMELLEGGSVWSQLRKGKEKGALPPYRMRMSWAVDTCKGMSYLHREDNQILHMDLKSPNLLLDSSLRVKVADFGLAEVKKLQSVAVEVTADGEHREGDKKALVIEGSIPWMAPECFRCEKYTEKADVYSFGVIMWELVTGNIPWANISQWSVSYQVGMAGKRLEIPNDSPKSAKSVMTDCFKDDPSSRPSFTELLKCVEKLPIEVSIEDPLGCAFWMKHFLSSSSVQWDVFLRQFLIHFDILDEKVPLEKWISENIEYTLALKAIVAWGPNQNALKKGDFLKEPATVTIEQFNFLLTFFGPINPKKPVILLELVSSIVKKKYFHGDVDTPEAIRRLSQQPEGTFLVRFSTRSPGTYTLSIRASASEISHVRLQGVGAEACEKMIPFIESQKSIRDPCPGSKYYPLFSAYADHWIASQSLYAYVPEKNL